MKVFIVAGEPSGDALGQAVMAGLKELHPDVTYEGVGGPLMASEGLKSLFPMAELSVMGLVEIIPRYPALRRRLNQTIAAAVASGADVLLTIDSPDFCLRVAKAVKAQTAIKTVHYVAPSVWAWRPKRADHMAAFIDHVLAVLPFEPPLMTQAGMGCDFVGHPVVAQTQATEAEAQAFRRQYGIEGPILLALPGSRRSEVTRLASVFGDVVRAMMDEAPALRVVVPAAGNVVGLVREAVKGWPGRPIIVPPAFDARSTLEKRAAFRAADVALAASGTVSLELAAADTPMVIAYDMAWISRVIMQHMALTDTVTLVNLVSESRVVPEFIGAKCRPELIAPALVDLLHHPDRQANELALTMERLGRGGNAPGLCAAQSVLNVVKGAT